MHAGPLCVSTWVGGEDVAIEINSCQSTSSDLLVSIVNHSLRTSMVIIQMESVSILPKSPLSSSSAVAHFLTPDVAPDVPKGDATTDIAALELYNERCVTCIRSVSSCTPVWVISCREGIGRS